MEQVTLGGFVEMFFITAFVLIGVVCVVALPGFLYVLLSSHRPPVWQVLAITAIWGTIITIVTLLVLGL